MSHLLIGGTNDGNRVNIPDDVRIFQMRCKSPIERIYFADDPIETCAEIEAYERQRIHGERSQFEVFTIQGMTADKMIERLIEKYKP